MTQKNKLLLIGGCLALLIGIGVTIFLFAKSGTSSEESNGGVTNQEISTDDPSDIVLDYYDAWRTAAQSTSTNPYEAGLASLPILSATLRAKLEAGKGSVTERDPVLCQTVPPERYISRTVFELENTIQILVMPKNATGTPQTLVTLNRHNDGWYIEDITCSLGEVAPESEFSFDMEGYLLKSVPPPLDPQYWYIVFEENGEKGHFAPLFLNGGSMCRTSGGSEAVCSVDTFTDAAKVHIYGDMNEQGIDVKRLEFVAE